MYVAICEDKHHSKGSASNTNIDVDSNSNSNSNNNDIDSESKRVKFSNEKTENVLFVKGLPHDYKKNDIENIFKGI